MDILEFGKLQNAFLVCQDDWSFNLGLLHYCEFDFTGRAVFELFVKGNSFGAFNYNLHLWEAEQIFFL